MFDNKEREKMQQSIDKLISEKYELTCKLREYETNGTFNEMRNRIKELESENEKLEDDWRESYAQECITRHENHRLVDRIEELEKENNQLKQDFKNINNQLTPSFRGLI